MASAHTSAPPPLRTDAPEGGVILEFDGVVKHYRSLGEVVRAADGVSFKLHAGEMLALHGPSGSGKTTLLLLAAAVIAPESGCVRFCGRKLGAFEDRETAEYLRGNVGFIHQNLHLLGGVSALDNASVNLILSGISPRAARKRVTPWLQRVGLADRLHHTPEQLSGGERQRVGIARALAKEPRLILADEPTGNLDSKRSRKIVELLHSIAHEREAAVLLVTHDLEAARIADRRMVLRDGRLLDAAGEAEARALIEGEADEQDQW